MKPKIALVSLKIKSTKGNPKLKDIKNTKLQDY
jgi:hypothetical protein